MTWQQPVYHSYEYITNKHIVFLCMSYQRLFMERFVCFTWPTRRDLLNYLSKRDPSFQIKLLKCVRYSPPRKYRECSNECWKLKRCLPAMKKGMGYDSVSEIMEPQTVRGSLHPQILEDRIYIVPLWCLYGGVTCIWIKYIICLSYTFSNFFGWNIRAYRIYWESQSRIFNP
jgi:hypothetical protein